MHYYINSALCNLPTQWRRNEYESGGGAPVMSDSGGHFGRAPPLFGSKTQLVVLVSAFVNRDGQYSLVSFLFAVLLLTVPPCPAICKCGGHVPPLPCPIESAPLSLLLYSLGAPPAPCAATLVAESPEILYPFCQVLGP